MLCCESGGSSLQDLDDLAVLVSQLVALGLDARIDVRAVRDDLNRNAEFDFAPFLFEGQLGPADRVVLTAAHRLTDDRLFELRRLARDAPTPCCVIGAFPSRQAIIGTRAKVSYVFGVDPEVVDLGSVPTLGGKARLDGPVFGVSRRSSSTVPRLLVVAPDLAAPAQTRALQALALSRHFRVAVLTNGQAKAAWGKTHGRSIPFFHYSEVPPAALAARFDICVSFAALPTSYRVQSLVANLVASGAALIDGTDGHQLAADVDAFIAGPPDLISLASFLNDSVLPNLSQIAREVRQSRTAEACHPRSLLWALGVDGPRKAGVHGRARRAVAPAEPAPIVFMPTNGVGLGHAQRCSQIAGELERERPAPVFAAFPGCMKLVCSYGFAAMPLVGRSQLHLRPHENDLANFLRLRALTARGGVLVFDGGYVFDSVYRTILDNSLIGVWVRRGLWQPTQDNSVALDREKVFERVIVPGEAFEELNAGYSRGEHLRQVGPIVQSLALEPPARQALRERLAERFDRRFDRLVVSLLGAGIAADRSAQIHALCGMLERRSDVLHLVVVWPSAVVHPAWFTWKNTRIVRTHHAATLGAAADLWISAAGYNSFHESLYGAIPTIFIPQMGPFMDDQRARAAAAVERALAATLEPTELVKLERCLGRFLDEGEAEAVRARLLALDLPPPGTSAAARVIEEVAHVG